jgi:hypothetical protein
MAASPRRRRLLATPLLVAALAGCGASSGLNDGSSYASGDCVTVGVDSSGNGEISQVSCEHPPTPDIDKVLSVLSGSDGTCAVGDRTFQDQVTNETYCLEDIYVMGLGSGSSTAAGPSPSPSATQSAGYAFDFCAAAWPALEKMNAAVDKGKTGSSGDEAWAPGTWPGPATIKHWNKVLRTLDRQATAEGQGGVASDAFESQMPGGYNPNTDQDLAAIGLGNETLDIAMTCAPGGQQTGSSAIDSYTTFDGFTWYPGD